MPDENEDSSNRPNQCLEAAKLADQVRKYGGVSSANQVEAGFRAASELCAQEQRAQNIGSFK